MLSKENRDKIVFSGLYEHKPEARYRHSCYASNIYHCCNWMFKPYEQYDGNIKMIDTYWSDGRGLQIFLSDDNFEEFDFLFDFQDVKAYTSHNITDYDPKDYWRVALGSGGWTVGKTYMLKKEAKPLKENVLKRLGEDISCLERRLDSKKRDYQMVLNGECDLRYI